MKRNLFWFLVTHTEEDKILHKAALNNFLNNFYAPFGINLHPTYSFKITSRPYTINVGVEFEVDGHEEHDDWSFLILVPINEDFYKNAEIAHLGDGEFKYNVNPWENIQEWKSFIIDALKYNFEIAKRIRDIKGIYNIKDRNAYDSVSMIAFHEYGGQQLYPNVIDKAAMIMYGIVKNHPFSDGNKRTGFLTLLSFLQKCGLTILIEKKYTMEELVQAAEDFMISVAESNPSQKDKTIDVIKEFVMKHVNIDINFQNNMIQLMKLNGGDNNG